MAGMTEPDRIIYGALIILALAVGALSWWAVRLARQTERESGALTVDQLRGAARSRLLPGPLMWGVWLGVNSISGKRLVLRDASGALVTEVHYNLLPIDGVIRHFELDGERYEYVKERELSGRMWLRAASSGRIVLSCDDGVRYRSIFLGTSDTEIVRIHNPNLFSEIGALTQGGERAGQLFYERKCHARVLSLLRPSLEPLAQCFVMLTAG